MEKETNVAAILRDKPKGTKLWSPIYGDCELAEILDSTYSIQVFSDGGTRYFRENGKYNENGEVCLFPSKEMQNWSKFAWKKGDVLLCGVDNLIIFDSWANDQYTEFYGRYSSQNYSKETDKLDTKVWTKETNENTINQHISKIEEFYNGKLNLSTLEIEKSESQFKDGDIVCFYGGRGCFDTIAIIEEQEEITFKTYTSLEIPIMKLYYQDNRFFPYTRKVRLTTDSEKQQLFDALAKKGKRWNAETKTLEDLPKKCELQPFDNVLVRQGTRRKWRIDLYSQYDKSECYPYLCLYGSWKQCIPYNDQTKHLLGTTDEWKGGEM